jgi:hypothetical protein
VTTTQDAPTHDPLERPAWKGPQAPIVPTRVAKPAPALAPKRNQQPMVVGAMLLCALVFAGVGAWLYSSGTKGEQVLVAATAIPAGTHLSAGYVAVETVRLPASLPHVDAAYLSEIAHYWTSANIEAGGLLSSAELTDQPPGNQANSLVGLVLAPAQHPSTVQPGERVACIFTGGQSAQNTGALTPSTSLGPPSAPVPFSELTPGQVIAEATIWQVPDTASGASGPFSSNPSAGSNTLDLTVQVSAAYAQTLAAASAAGQVAIVTGVGS